MADISYNTVANGEYTPQVGDRYEISPGNWGTMPPPTVGLQNKLAKMTDEGASDLELAREIVKDAKNFGEEDVIFGMAQAVVKDFFTLTARIVEKLMQGLPQSDQ